MITAFRQFNSKILPKLNRLLGVVNKIDNLRGDEFIKVKKSGAGTNISMDLGKVRERVAKNNGGATFGGTLRAACTADAGAGSTIAATLYAADGTTGDAITVHCSIANGTDLDEAIPRLEIGLDIPVYRSTFDNAGTPELRWYYDGTFQASEDCTCEQADAVFNSVTIASDQNVTLDGVGGNSYITYNSSAGEMELWTDGTKITSWKA